MSRLTSIAGEQAAYAKLAGLLGVTTSVLAAAGIEASMTPEAAAAQLKRLVGPQAWRSAAASGTKLRASTVLLRALRAEEPEPEPESEPEKRDLRRCAGCGCFADQHDEVEGCIGCERCQTFKSGAPSKEESQREAVVGTILKRQGLIPGTPDYVAARRRYLAGYDAGKRQAVGPVPKSHVRRQPSKRDRVIDAALERQGIADPKERAAKRRELARAYDIQFGRKKS